ncbi:hypothetical protein PLESTF_000960100 [Pleodorina starrii]|nr:hypothetical protein PLESTF_000960100 [Pleodorina starrii]
MVDYYGGTLLEPGEQGAWNAKCVRQIAGHTAEVTSMSVFLNGSRIMTTSKDATVRIWDTGNMTLVRTFGDHHCEVYGSAVSVDGSWAITLGQLGPESSSVLIWHPNSGKVLHNPKDHSGRLDVCAISGPGGLAAVTGVKGILFVWDTWSGEQRYRTEFHGPRSCCRFSPCGLFILVGGHELGELVLLESRYGQELVRMHTSMEPGTLNTLTDCFFLSETPPRVPFTGGNSGGNGSSAVGGGAAYANPRGSATGGCGGPHEGFRLRYYCIDPWEKKASELRNPRAMSSADRASFPTRFACVCTDGSIRVFNLKVDSFYDAIWRDERLEGVKDVDMSRDGTLMFVIYRAGSRQEGLHLYDFLTGEPVWDYPNAHEGTYGLYLVASGDSGLVADGGGTGETRPLRGKLVTTGGDRKVRVFDLAKRQLTRTIVTAQDIVRPQINRAFDQMLTADGCDAWTCLWDGCCASDVLRRFVGHEDSVRCAALSPDEEVLATGSHDKTVRIWDVGTGNVLHVIGDHRDTVFSITFAHSNWIVTSTRYGVIMGFHLKSGTPVLLQGPTLRYDEFQLSALKPMPLSAVVAGPTFPPLLAIWVDGRVAELRLSVRQPMPKQVLDRVRWGMWDLDHVKKLADTFPGLAVVPSGLHGNTLLHEAVVFDKVDCLRVLLSHCAAVSSAPLPANDKGKTPLDLAPCLRSLQCVELLLADEVKRPPHLRLAAMKAWSGLAAHTPAVLVKFLNAVGIEEPTDAEVMTVPVREGIHLITHGSQEFNIDEGLWELALWQREGYRRPLASCWRWCRSWVTAVPYVRSLTVQAVPGVCGLPYVALRTRSMADSFLGALVRNNVRDAFSTDIVVAVVTYKWNAYAGSRVRNQCWLYAVFMVLYIVTTTLGLSWNAHVDREAMYGNMAQRGRAVARIVCEAALLLINAWYLVEEVRELMRHGRQYFTGHNSSWNWVELLSCIMVNLVVLLQVLELEEARWVMSCCTILLGIRLLRVLSDYHSHHHQPALLPAVVLLTYALAFRQITVYYEQVGEGHRTAGAVPLLVDNGGISGEFTHNFDTFPDSLLSVYYFMVSLGAGTAHVATHG